ncbi:MAG: hypothetical protein ACLUSP_10525 [Christensenellales bacterium]
MSQPSNPDIPKEDQPELPAVKGTDFKVIRFNEFEWLLTKHPTKAMNYNLGSGEKLTDVIFYFDVTQSAFAKLAADNDFEKFIAWENFAVPSDMTFASFAEANYEYLNRNGRAYQIRFRIQRFSRPTDRARPFRARSEQARSVFGGNSLYGGV